MSEEKEKADENNDKVFESDAVQVTPELTNENQEDTKVALDKPEESAIDEASAADQDIPVAEETSPSPDDPTEDIPSSEESTDHEIVSKDKKTTDSPVIEGEATDTKETIKKTDTISDPIVQKDIEEKQPDDKSPESNLAKKEKETEAEEVDHHEEIDYGTFDKKELLDAIADLSHKDDGFKKGKTLFGIRDAYDVLFEQEKKEALEKYIKEDGSADDFEYKSDQVSVKFEEYFKILKEKRVSNAKDQEKQKDQNLAKKIELLERLRVFIDDDENTESISELKKMQEEWKAIGPVPHNQNRTLWANYNALMDLYYDHRSIYFELKELDRRKNLETKLALCEQAEELDHVENLNEAIKKLNELHDEYKHIGPIPKEQQESTWLRFKAASDKVYIKRKEYFSNLKETFEENLVAKTKLTDAAVALMEFTSDSISEWNAKTKEVLELQKQWEKIGSMPKENAKKVNRLFWGGFKGFFKHKSEFFKSLDSKREENLKLKEELITKANELKGNEDWMNTANAFKNLQKEWKELGPVPEKLRDKVYKQFKAACDEFFNKRRAHSKDVESSYDENLSKKEAVCAKLEALIGAADLHPENVYKLQDEFNSLGFVPKKSIKSIQNRYQTALNRIIKEANDFQQDEIDELKSLISINKIKSGPHGDQKLYRKEQALKRKIQNLENDISIWKNNIGFFANSKNANELMADFELKIKKADAELAELKEELKLITYAG